ncbi:glutathione S-transferase family protein [Archangium violaceum]|uniref:glutathione S-transferase family protein n=1 Tax=Archangium violaceum TaxID=83451 RepID=UPI00193B4940|nr:glutathione S-transferase family protein [Archangium violaceum]QRK12991.1 glutathione S-transferase family protein [Archangium violaceum]
MKFYDLSYGVYPRRVSIYLLEKGLTGIERISVRADTTDINGWSNEWREVRARNPAGTVPILETEDGTLIRQSTAILEYLEDRFPEPSLLGKTAEERAFTRELVSLINEANVHFGTYCHKGNPLFAGKEVQSAEAAEIAWQAYVAQLSLIDKLSRDAEFLTGDRPTIADCMLMSLLQFAEGLYGKTIPPHCERLSSWYRRFSLRPSAAAPEYPPAVVAIAQGKTVS